MRHGAVAAYAGLVWVATSSSSHGPRAARGFDQFLRSEWAIRHFYPCTVESTFKDTLHCVGKNDGRSHWRYVRIVCQAAAAMWLDRQLCRFAGGRGMHSACCVSKGSVNSCRPDAAQRAANSASRAAHRCAEVSRVFRGCPARKVMMCHP